MQRSLRRARLEDVSALNELARLAYADYLPVIGRKPQPMAVDWATLIDDHEIWIMAGEATSAIASLALKVKPDHVLIWSVAVAPEHQHRGIGRRLMAFAEERARALRHDELRLFTNARMKRNILIATVAAGIAALWRRPTVAAFPSLPHPPVTAPSA